MRVLVACEESQAVTKEMRRLGHEAYSCDIQPCSGGHPEWHLQVDALELLKLKWDMIIAHPPCTYLTVTGNRWFNVERYGEKAIQRIKDREAAAEFFMAFANADCPRIAIENPVGAMSTIWRKPEQIVHPYMFGDPERKATCLWLKGLNPLIETDVVPPPNYCLQERERHRFSVAYGNDETAARREGESQKQNLPRHSQSNGAAMGRGCEGGKG